MSHHDTRTLLALGRKAGLRTGELYRALSTRPPGPGDNVTSERDTNGFVQHFAANGQRTYQPGLAPRS